MCDYSLYVFSNRLAREGEELTTYRFSTGCTGFVGVSDITERETTRTWLGVNWPRLTSRFFPRRHVGPTAVCIPPGAEIRLDSIDAMLRQRLELSEREDAIFIQATPDEFSYRDGLRFRNGRQILLQELRAGQRIYIRSLSGEARSHNETETQEMYA